MALQLEDSEVVATALGELGRSRMRLHERWHSSTAWRRLFHVQEFAIIGAGWRKRTVEGAWPSGFGPLEVCSQLVHHLANADNQLASIWQCLNNYLLRVHFSGAVSGCV
jgi:hypothetical protein